MKPGGRRKSRKQVGEEVVSLIARQAILAGATLKQLELETGQKRQELQRILDNLAELEEMTRRLQLEE